MLMFQNLPSVSMVSGALSHWQSQLRSWVMLFGLKKKWVYEEKPKLKVKLFDNKINEPSINGVIFPSLKTHVFVFYMHRRSYFAWS